MIDVTYSPEYAQFKERYYGLKTVVLNGLPVQYRGDEAYIPHHDYTNVTGDGPWKEVIEDIKQKLGVSWIEARLIGARDLAPTPFSAFLLDLKPEGELMQSFDKKTRNEVRRALGAGFIVEELHDTEELITLYRENMLRHGTPPKSDRYFPALFEAFGDRAVAIAARRGGELAGVNVLIRGDHDARLLMNLSRPKFWPQYINNLLYWETMKYAQIHGLKVLDFGGGSIADHRHNHFKLGFGARMMPIVGYTSGSPLRRFSKWLQKKKRNIYMRFQHG